MLIKNNIGKMNSYKILRSKGFYFIFYCNFITLIIIAKIILSMGIIIYEKCCYNRSWNNWSYFS